MSRTQQVVRASIDNVLRYGRQKNNAKKKRSEGYHQSTAQEREHRPLQFERSLLTYTASGASPHGQHPPLWSPEERRQEETFRRLSSVHRTGTQASAFSVRTFPACGTFPEGRGLETENEQS